MKTFKSLLLLFVTSLAGSNGGRWAVVAFSFSGTVQKRGLTTTTGQPEQRRQWVTTRSTTGARTSTSLASSSREEEIAKLEEQLRRLKEEEATDEQPQGQQQQQQQAAPVVEDVEESAAVAVLGENSDDFVGRGPAKRPVQPMEEMMSEAWKSEQEEGGGGIGGSITTILAGVALVVFLGFFSQVPVGQEDLTKYQAIKTSTQIDLGDINPVRSGDF